MSFRECMDEAVKGKEISRDEADRLIRDFERLRDGHAGTQPALADALAKQDLLESLTAENAHKRRKAKLSLLTIRKLDADVRNHKNASGKVDVAEGLRKKLEHFGGARFSSVARVQSAIVGEMHARMVEALERYKRGRLLGDASRKNAGELTNVLRENFGEDTGDAVAKVTAQAWKAVSDDLRKMFNAAGGAIGKLDNWGMPQHHDARALRAAGREAWKDAIRPHLDVARMKHALTGKPLREAELDRVLDEVFDNISMEGWAKREPTRQSAGKGAMANQHAEHRFLVFRSADDWLAYQEKFGFGYTGGDIFTAMMGHINAMARDIAAMQVLGPNPEGTIAWMQNVLEKEGKRAAAGHPSRLGGRTGEKAIRYASKISAEIDLTWKSLRGTLETPTDSAFADVMSGARGLISASVLGQAAISSVSDLGTHTMARLFAGLPAHNVIPQVIKAFGAMERREAVAAGLVLDEALNALHVQARYMGSLSLRQWGQFFADRTIALSGLAAWTQANKHAFGLEFMASAASHARTEFAALPDAFRNVLDRYGITPRDWELIGKAKLHEKYDGSQILRPAEIAERIDPSLARRYLEMIQAETEYAIVTGSHRAKVKMTFGSKPGNFLGEVIRSGTQFKMFPVSFLMMHGGRLQQMLGGGSYAGGAAYAGGLLIGTTFLGAVAMQLKQVIAGKDPRQPDDWRFWLAAMAQGGGLGLYGDFLFSDTSRYGDGPISSLGGPLVSRVGDVVDIAKIAAGNAGLLADYENKNLGRAFTRFLRGNIPGGNIWYTRLAWERIALDQMQFLVDPQANKAFKRQQQKLQRETGQGYWWQPGSMSPARAPGF